MTGLARISAAVLLVALAAASAQAFSLADQLGRIPSLFGGQSSSRLAKPYAVLHESFYPTSVAWSPDGKYVADTGILTQTIHIWNVQTKRTVQTLSAGGFNSDYHAMTWSPDGKYLAVCTNTQLLRVTVWDVEQRTPMIKIYGPKYRACESVAFDSTGKFLAVGTGTIGSSVQIYSTRNWKLTNEANFTELPVGFGFSLNEIAFQPNSSVLAIGVNGYFHDDHGYPHGRVIFWNINAPSPDPTNGLLTHSFIPYHIGALDSLAYNPSGSQLATGPNSGGGSTYTHNLVTASVRIWEPMSHRLLGAPLDGHDRAGGINGLAYSADGRYVIAAHTGPTGEIDFIDARSFKVVDTLYADHLIGAIAVNPLAPMFVATDNNKLMIWSFK
jgi:WD40 repeat protein